MLEQIKKPILTEYADFRRAFAGAFDTENGLLKEVFAHILKGQGKQMRPIILLLASQIVGQVNENTIRAAVALELLHTASLLHDDVVDYTNMRRGQATINEVWGNKVAVLTGDYVLSKSLEYAISTKDLCVLERFSLTGQNLSEGELLQLANSKALTQTEADYFSVIRNKTAKLFAVCTGVGAVTAQGSDEQIQTMTEFGELLGMCFQLKDDLLDYSQHHNVGKPTMNDIRDGKITLPLIAALHTASSDECKRMKQILAQKEFTEDTLQDVRSFVERNGGVAYTKQYMLDFKQRALHKLQLFAHSEAKESIIQLLEFTLARTH